MGWIIAISLYVLGSVALYVISNEGAERMDRSYHRDNFKYAALWPFIVLGFGALDFSDWWDSATYFIFGDRT